jgi:hypothetical protein
LQLWREIRIDAEGHVADLVNRSLIEDHGFFGLPSAEFLYIESVNQIGHLVEAPLNTGMVRQRFWGIQQSVNGCVKFPASIG